MDATTQRALFAVGLAALTAYIFVRLAAARSRAAHEPVRGREWISDHRPGPGGRLSRDELADDALEDSFPASDPPAYTAEIGAGAPRH